MKLVTESFSAPPAQTRPGFGSLLQSEWTKLRTLRATWILVALAVGLSVGFSALIAMVTGLTFDSWSPEIKAGFDPVLTTLSGWLFGIILLTVLSATSVSSEYTTGIIRSTMIITPRRSRVFEAKAVVVASLGTVIGTFTMLGMFLVSQPIFSYYGLETASPGDSTAVRFLVVGGILQGPIYTLLPMTFSWLLRSTASAVTVSVSFFFLPWMLAPLLPLWVRENVLRFLPDSAKDSMMGMLAHDASTYLADGPALAVIAAWLFAGLAASAFVVNLRDV